MESDSKVTFIGNYTYLDGKKVSAMVDCSQEIKYSTFIKNVGVKELMDQFPDYNWKRGDKNGLKMSDDYAVTFNSSFYGNVKCYYVYHSSMEYVWLVK